MEEQEFDLQAELNRALAEDSAPGVEVGEAAEPQYEEAVNGQSNGRTEQDSYYADMRRKQELDAIRRENRALQAQLDRTRTTLQNFFDGDDIDDLLDQAVAQADDISVDDVRANRLRELEAASLQAELEMYRQNEVNRRMEEDLRAIQSIDPTVTSLSDLSPNFLSLRFNPSRPMDAKSAFLRARQIDNRQRTPKPASSGSLYSTGQVPGEFFTSDELDRLTSKDLDDPRVMEKAMRSMARLK